MGLNTQIDAALLNRIGVTTAHSLHDALLGLTIREAATQLRQELALKAAVEGMNRGAVSGYTINGRSITATADLMERAARGLETMLSFGDGGGGPICMGVRM